MITITRRRWLRFGPGALDKFAPMPPRSTRVIGSITVWSVSPLELFIRPPNRALRFEMKLCALVVRISELVTVGAERRLQFSFSCLLWR